MKYATANRIWQFVRRAIIALVALYLIGASRLAPQFVDATIALSDPQRMLLVFLEFILVSVLCAAFYPLVEGDRLRRLISCVAAASFVLVVSLVMMFLLQIPLSGEGPFVYTTLAASIYVLLIGIVIWFWGPLSCTAQVIEG